MPETGSADMYTKRCIRVFAPFGFPRSIGQTQVWGPRPAPPLRHLSAAQSPPLSKKWANCGLGFSLGIHVKYVESVDASVSVPGFHNPFTVVWASVRLA